MELIQIIASFMYVVFMMAFWYMGGAGVERWPFNLLPPPVAQILTDKRWRRYGGPAVTLLFGVVMGHWWQAPIAAALLFVGTILPITLVGSDVLKNWVWHPIHGLIYGSSVLAMSLLSGWLWGLIAAVTVAVLYAIYIITAAWLNKGTQLFDSWAVQELLTPATIGGAIITIAWVV